MTVKKGRPRSFDRDVALEKAMLLFWERGYEAASIRDLTHAMGITTPSLYAAFTDKQTLFAEAVDIYSHRYGNYIQETIETEPTAYQAVRQLLTRSAIQHTLPGRPPGCLILNGARNGSSASEIVANGLRARRTQTATMIEASIHTDIERGVLPAQTDARDLTTFFVAVWQGLSQLARDGHGRQDLERVVNTAMTTWPAADL